MKNIFELTFDFYRESAPSREEFQSLINVINFKVPDDYICFMKNSNGAEGTVGEKNLALWNISDILFHEDLYKNENSDFNNKYFIFGSNSGIFTYTFNKINGQIEELDLYEETYSRIMGNTIEELILKLSEEPL